MRKVIAWSHIWTLSRKLAEIFKEACPRSASWGSDGTPGFGGPGLCQIWETRTCAFCAHPRIYKSALLPLLDVLFCVGDSGGLWMISSCSLAWFFSLSFPVRLGSFPPTISFILCPKMLLAGTSALGQFISLEIPISKKITTLKAHSLLDALDSPLLFLILELERIFHR